MAKRRNRKNANVLMGKYHQTHLRNLRKYEEEVGRLYDEVIEMATRLLPANLKLEEDELFSFRDHPALQKKIDELMKFLARNTELRIANGMKAEEELSLGYFKDVATSAYGASGRTLPPKAIEILSRTNRKAQEAFRARKTKGLGLSERIWSLTGQFKEELEMAIDIGIRDGIPANQLAREIKKYLHEPNKLFRRVRDKHGMLKLSQRAKAYHPGRGVYRSSYKNARRLAVTEGNIAYHNANHAQRKEFDWIVGIEVHLSSNHTCNGVPFVDICDDLKGIYPKDFKFVGWHPMCYSDDSMVLTGRGWKYFKEVVQSDTILSLNPETREPEWVGIQYMQRYEHNGDMVRFHNRSLDILVTPEHEMVYLGKANGDIRRMPASEYRSTHGAIYRACEWTGGNDDAITIGSRTYDLIAFAEFMGYWLADGSVARKRRAQISITQQEGDPNKENIISCIRRMGLVPKVGKSAIYIFDRELRDYLMRFGKAPDKYVPAEIKGASRDVIQVFLDAFVSCDGHVRKPKAFIGNRGSLCIPKGGERLYCTTSKQMASDIGELLLKVGNRPSYSVARVKGKEHKFSNGTYTINEDCINIRECRSKTASVFSKSIEPYNGYVYDLTLDRNHIMYIHRDGKCFWGSNCRCGTREILATPEEFDKWIESKGKAPVGSKNEVKDLPKNFKQWQSKNADRIDSASERGKLPYFLRDNKDLLEKQEGKLPRIDLRRVRKIDD